MTTTVGFPSEGFPSYPGIEIQAPEGWEPTVVAGTAMAVSRAVEAGEFMPNVIVAFSRFTAGYELNTAIDAVRTKFSTLQESKEIGSELTEIDGVQWSHTEVAFIDPRVGTLIQASHICTVESGSVVDLVQITGTLSGSQAHSTLLDEVRSIQRSAVLR